jgi:hypothetical protein
VFCRPRCRFRAKRTGLESSLFCSASNSTSTSYPLFVRPNKSGSFRRNTCFSSPLGLHERFLVGRDRRARRSAQRQLISVLRLALPLPVKQSTHRIIPLSECDVQKKTILHPLRFLPKARKHGSSQIEENGRPDAETPTQSVASASIQRPDAQTLPYSAHGTGLRCA